MCKIYLLLPISESGTGMFCASIPTGDIEVVGSGA